MSEANNLPPERPDANSTNGAFSGGEPPLPPPRGPVPKKNYVWLYYFAFLIVASIGVAVLVIWFSRNQQLTRERLDAAEKLWKETGPKSYKLVYTEKLRDEKPTTFAVTVRGKKVAEVLMEGKPLEKNQDQKEDPKMFCSMEAQFLAFGRLMDLDQKAGAPEAYCTAIFDPKTGALLHYVHYVPTTRQRVEVNYQPVEPLKD